MIYAAHSRYVPLAVASARYKARARGLCESGDNTVVVMNVNL